jgi:elongation factor 3
VAVNLPEIVPRVTDAMADARIQTKEAAEQAMLDACGNVGNRDIEPFVPTLVGCILIPSKVADCIHGLASTTFVQQVEAPTLSIIVPLLQRGLREPVTAIKRKSALIIENMAKLVDNPAEACPFLPLLLPGLERVSQPASAVIL